MVLCSNMIKNLSEYQGSCLNCKPVHGISSCLTQIILDPNLSSFLCYIGEYSIYLALCSYLANFVGTASPGVSQITSPGMPHTRISISGTPDPVRQEVA